MSRDRRDQPAPRQDRAAGGKDVAVGIGKANSAQLVDKLHVATSENTAKREVVLHLGPSELPDLQPGDRLCTPAEVQVTTQADVLDKGPGTFDPHVRAMLILTDSAKTTSAKGKRTQKIAEATQTISTKEHHGMFVFGQDAWVDIGQKYSKQMCHVNLVMWAWHGKARPQKDVVIVGANQGNYLAGQHNIEDDRARLNAVRERGVTKGDRDVHGSSNRNVNVPTNKQETLLHSHPLVQGNGAPAQGEEYFVEAEMVVDTNGRARFSTKLFLTDQPNATKAHGGFNDAKPGEISEHNGVNVLPGKPETIKRVAVFRMDKPQQQPVYVNAVADSAVPGGGNAKVDVKRATIRVTRYTANL